MEHLGDEQSGVLIADETGFLKKGEKSVGVARQYTGTAGDTVNCQVGVFLAYASNKGTAFIDRALYLPEEWANDSKRRAEASVPEEATFANKAELAKRMLERAFEAGVTVRWVVADSSFYGRSHEFREWLQKRGRAYAVMVPKTNAVDLGGRKKKIEHRAARRAVARGCLVGGPSGGGLRRGAPLAVGMLGARRRPGEGDEPVAVGSPWL